MLFRDRPCRSDAESFHSEVGNGYTLERRKAVRGSKSYGTVLRHWKSKTNTSIWSCINCKYFLSLLKYTSMNVGYILWCNRQRKHYVSWKGVIHFKFMQKEEKAGCFCQRNIEERCRSRDNEKSRIRHCSGIFYFCPWKVLSYRFKINSVIIQVSQLSVNCSISGLALEYYFLSDFILLVFYGS